MKFIHTSDWHLGILFHGVSRREEQRAFSQELIRTAVQEGVDAVAIAGDIFNTSVADARAVALYSETVTQLSKNGIKVLAIAGNHDGAERLQMCAPLLEASGVYVAGRLKNKILPVTVRDADFYLIPYFNTEEVRALYPGKPVKTYEDAVRVVLDTVKERMDPSKKNIAVCHCFVGGAQASGSDRSAVVGSLNIVGKDLFCDFYYTALGHIHKNQKLKENIRYCGTPLQYSFSEEGSRNCMILVDTEQDEIRDIPIQSGRRARVFRGTYAELMGLADCDDFVKLEITDRFAGRAVIDAFRGKFENLLMINGRQTANGTGHTMSVHELEHLEPKELMNRFYREMMDEEPGPAQTALFEEALNAVQGEEDGM